MVVEAVASWWDMKVVSVLVLFASLICFFLSQLLEAAFVGFRPGTSSPPKSCQEHLQTAISRICCASNLTDLKLIKVIKTSRKWFLVKFNQVLIG